MSRRRNWVAQIRSNFDDLYFNEHLTKKRKLGKLFFYET